MNTGVVLVVLAISTGIAWLVFRVAGDSVRRQISLWRWRREYARHRLRYDISSLLKHRRAA